MTRSEAMPAPAALWRNRPYLLLMSGKTTQLIGEGVGTFAAPLVAYSLTHSVVLAGAIAAVGEGGSLLATLPAGVAADRLDRRRLLIVASLVGTALWAFTSVTAMSGGLTGAELAAALFGVAIVTAVFNATETGAIRAITRPEQLSTAMAAIQGRSAAAQLLSGPVGGLLYALGAAMPFAAGAVGHAAVVVCTWCVRAPLNGELSAARRGHPVAQLVEGIRFFAATPILRTSLWLVMLINLTVNGALIAVNLELVQTRTTPLLIGLLDTVAGGVMLLGSVIAPRLMRRYRAGRLAIAGLAAVAAGFLGMAVAHSYGGYVGFMAVACVLIPVVNSGIGGYIAAIVPDALQGRVGSVSSLGYLAVAPIAPVVASLALAALGIVATLWVFALVLAGGVVAIALVPEIRRIGKPDSWAADAIEWPLA